VLLIFFTRFLSNKTHFKGKADICFCLYTCSLKDDVIDDDYDLKLCKMQIFKDSIFGCFIEKKTLKGLKTSGSTGI